MALTACGKPAPLEINFRASRLDSNGLVLIVHNKGNGYLSCKMIARSKVRNQSVSYPFDMGPGGKKEIGLLESGWTFKTGEQVEIEVEGYRSHSFKVP